MDVYWCIVDGNFYDMHYVVDEGSQITGIPNLCRFMGTSGNACVRAVLLGGQREWARVAPTRGATLIAPLELPH